MHKMSHLRDEMLSMLPNVSVFEVQSRKIMASHGCAEQVSCGPLNILMFSGLVERHPQSKPDPNVPLMLTLSRIYLFSIIPSTGDTMVAHQSQRPSV